MAWEALVSIYEEATDYVRDERSEPPLACPYDGEPLLSTPNGAGLFCKLGNYEWPLQRRLI